MLNKRLFLSNLSDEKVFSGYVLPSGLTRIRFLMDIRKTRTGKFLAG